MKLIIISGKAGSGKDYLIKNVIIPILTKRNKSVCICSFANYLKTTLYTNKSFEFNELYDDKTSISRKALITVAETLKKQNTEIFHNAMYHDILKMETYNYDYCIISDLRLQSEYDFLQKLNYDKFFVRITSLNRTKDKMLKESIDISKHSTETELDKFVVDLDIKNDYEDDTKIIIENFKKLLG
jgi:phosphomevalonate kinase